MKRRTDGRYRKTVDGVTFYAKTERELYKKIMEYEERKEDGPTFAEVADEWWTYEVEKLSPSTVRGYEKAHERAVEWFGNERIKDITTAQVMKELNKFARLGYAKKTVLNHKIVINRIFHYGIVENYITVNPASEAEIPRNLPQKRRTAATVNDEERIKESAKEWLLPFFALCTGLRKGELIGLRWEDIDLERNIITVERSIWYGAGTNIKEPKTEAGKRKIPILKELRELLTTCKRNPKEYVFGGEKPLTEKAFRVRYKKFQEHTGVTATLHQLRKSFTTMAVKSGVAPEVLKVIIGHKNISTTLDIYTEVREERLQAAASIIKLN